MSEIGGNYDNSHVPIVEYGVDTDPFKRQAVQLSSRISAMGFGDLGKDVLSLIPEVDRNAKRAVERIGEEEAAQAQQIVGQVVGHSKSGYVPTGNLRNSIKPHKSLGGFRVQIYPEATNNGYKYGQSVEFAPEFGNKHATATPYMKPSADIVNERFNSIFVRCMAGGVYG